MSRRSVLGAVSLVIVVAFFAIAVPLIAERAVEAAAFDDSGRFIVDEYTTLLLPDGWEIESRSELFTTLTDGDHQLVLVESIEESASPEEILGEFREVYASDPANVVTDIESFATDAGGDAASYRALLSSDPNGDGSGFGAVSQNGRTLQPGATGPADLDDPFYDEFDAIVRSVEITTEPREDN